MTCNIKNACTDKVFTKDLCWIAGTDDEFIYNLKYLDENEIPQITDITGYSSVLEVRVKDTDITPTLVLNAQLDVAEGKFLFQVTDVQTLALLTKTRLNQYKYRVVETDNLGRITIRVEGNLSVRL